MRRKMGENIRRLRVEKGMTQQELALDAVMEQTQFFKDSV